MSIKPTGISHSIVPDKPMTYNQWMGVHPQSKPIKMSRNYDYNHQAYGHYTKRNGVDFKEGSYKCLPDAGKQFMQKRMREMGFSLYQDFKHRDRDEETRWWFKDTRTWQARTPGIEKLGYTQSGELKIA